MLALYPEYVDDANAYELMADADQRGGDTKAEAAILHRVRTRRRPVAGRSEASCRASKPLPAAMPKPSQPWSGSTTSIRSTTKSCTASSAICSYAQKHYDGAIREYNALVASNPVDKAGAEFDLAQAYFAAGQKDKAQDSVLAALETAPGYRPAQKLLLELQQPPAKSN